MSMERNNENKKLLAEAKNRRIKLKKNAFDVVDFVKESKSDPKFKTELCKSWVESGFCIYGNKCRFAHGKEEIMEKPINNQKYKQKACLTFFQYGFCNYGIRCHFKHDERKVNEIPLPHFTTKLLTTEFSEKSRGDNNHRLSIFREISEENKISLKTMPRKESLASANDIKSLNDYAYSTRILTHNY